MLRTIWTVVVFLMLSAISAEAARYKCYKCASRYLSMNWGRYLPLNPLMERSVDTHCVKSPERHAIVECGGPCVLVNVTGTYQGKPTFFGLARECSTDLYRKAPTLTRDRECEIKTISIKGAEFTAEYCHCTGHRCNGNEMRSPTARRHLQNASASRCVALSTPVLLLFSWLFFH